LSFSGEQQWRSDLFSNREYDEDHSQRVHLADGKRLRLAPILGVTPDERLQQGGSFDVAHLMVVAAKIGRDLARPPRLSFTSKRGRISAEFIRGLSCLVFVQWRSG
jgi:hypothetical protein